MHKKFRKHFKRAKRNKRFDCHARKRLRSISDNLLSFVVDLFLEESRARLSKSTSTRKIFANALARVARCRDLRHRATCSRSNMLTRVIGMFLICGPKAESVATLETRIPPFLTTQAVVARPSPGISFPGTKLLSEILSA